MSAKKNKQGGVEANSDSQSTEAGLMDARRAKAKKSLDAGNNPFANDVDTADRSWIIDLRRRFAGAKLEATEEEGERYDADKVQSLAGDDSVHVLGRMMSRRGFGKAAFLKLRDGSGEIQLFAKKDILADDFPVLETLDMADHIEARGTVMVTRTGELSVQVTQLRLLSKAIRPLPDKWHGLTDVELRYRRRYVDLVANPEVAFALRARSILIQGVRDYLDRRQFLEVETPTLHSVVGGASAKPFNTHHNALDLNLFLRIAPELYLKRLLVGGFERVYEVGRCYRNEGISTRHNPEFTMLEFYQAYATYETLMPMTEELFRHADQFLKARFTEDGLAHVYDGWVAAREFTIDEPFARVPMHEAIARAAVKAGLPEDVLAQLDTIKISPASAGETPNREAGDALVKQWAKHNERSGAIDWTNFRRGLAGCGRDGDRVFAAYEYLAEPFLAEDYRSADGSKSVPGFVIDYPAEVSPLARRKDSDPSLTDRFELFVETRELCNAFSELNDPDDQAARFQDQVARKAQGADETMDYDEDYVRALQHGMPPAAGFGMGIDRLAMTLTGQPSIRDVIAFPLLRPESEK